MPVGYLGGSIGLCLVWAVSWDPIELGRGLLQDLQRRPFVALVELGAVQAVVENPMGQRSVRGVWMG